MDSSSILRAEIYEQPAVIQRFLDLETETVARVGYELSRREVLYLLIAARGTSDNAARYGQYIFGSLNRLPVALAAPSLITRYGSPPRLEKTLVIGLSQSGESPDIVSVVAEARRQGAPTLAITNEPASPLAQASEYLIELHAGAERSIAATKTYTAELTALALLAMSLTGMPPGAGLLHALPGWVAQSLEAEDAAQAAAAAISRFEQAVVIGRGYNYATAFEVALKIKELANVKAEPYSSADFAHGPVGLAGEAVPAILLSVGDTFREEMTALAARVQRQGSPLVGIGDGAPWPGHAWIPVPPGMPEWLSPVAAVAPGQLLAFHLTRMRGLDPDQPRNISKVTYTL